MGGWDGEVLPICGHARGPEFWDEYCSLGAFGGASRDATTLCPLVEGENKEVSRLGLDQAGVVVSTSSLLSWT